MPEPMEAMLGEILKCLSLGETPLTITGRGRLRSAFAVTDLAIASIGAAGASVAELMAVRGAGKPRVVVDRALASQWFTSSARSLGWKPPQAWDPVAGDYLGEDGWVRLHTNAPRHRAAALAVLGVQADGGLVGQAVSKWAVEELETAVVEAGGAAAAMRSRREWEAHPQGQVVAEEPLVYREPTSRGEGYWRPVDGGQPLAGLRVLDMTRVLAGPVGTRLLAGWGAEVLRIDPPDWDEAGLALEVTLGKHCARLDLHEAQQRERWWALLREADVLVHGYRPGALEALGLGRDERERRRPGLVDVSLDAYGWSGPWHGRRGFDSLVQMSSGIAAEGMAAFGTDRPTPLPVQALDQATGYLIAASVIAGLIDRERHGVGSRWRASLARTARLLIDHGRTQSVEEPLEPADPIMPPNLEETPWGPAHRLPGPLVVDGVSLRWDLPARPLGSDSASFAPK